MLSSLAGDCLLLQSLITSVAMARAEMCGIQRFIKYTWLDFARSLPMGLEAYLNQSYIKRPLERFMRVSHCATIQQRRNPSPQSAMGKCEDWSRIGPF